MVEIDQVDRYTHHYVVSVLNREPMWLKSNTRPLWLFRPRVSVLNREPMWLK